MLYVWHDRIASGTLEPEPVNHVASGVAGEAPNGDLAG